MRKARKTKLQNAISKCEVGKHLPEHIYVHRSSVCKLPVELRLLVAQAELIAGNHQHDLIKIAKDGYTVSLLRYPTFDTEAHPELEYSICVNIHDGSFVFTNFKLRENRPILHRKEVFVDPSYPLYPQFVALTEQEEKLGLLSRRDIGYKQQWEAILAQKKVAIRGHFLQQTQ